MFLLPLSCVNIHRSNENTAIISTDLWTEIYLQFVDFEYVNVIANDQKRESKKDRYMKNEQTDYFFISQERILKLTFKEGIERNDKNCSWTKD